MSAITFILRKNFEKPKKLVLTYTLRIKSINQYMQLRYLSFSFVKSTVNS